MVDATTCLLVSQLCCSILSYDPSGTKYDINSRTKQMACTVTQHIEKESKANSIEPTLLTALIIVESRFKPWAVSRSNACGLTQVIPKWTGGKESRKVKYTCKQLKNPRTSITAGARILNWWIKYKGSVRKGLCGYNAGFRGCKSAKNYANAVFKVKKALEGTGNVN